MFNLVLSTFSDEPFKSLSGMVSISFSKPKTVQESGMKIFFFFIMKWFISKTVVRKLLKMCQI